MITAADRRELGQLADQLRALADDVAAGRLPDKGAAADLGRRVEKALDKRRIKPRPGARANQTRGLAAALAKHTGIDRIRTTYDESRRTWRLDWGSGPTYDTARKTLHAIAHHYPAVDVDHLELCRSTGAPGEIAVLLRYLDDHGVDDQVRSACARRAIHFARETSYHNYLNVLATDLASDVDYPERYDDTTRRRISAIKALDPHGRTGGHDPTSDAWLAFGDRLLADGWPATRDWLDQDAA